MTETKCVYLAWQDQTTKKWHVIGRLSRTAVGYAFRYTNGAKNVWPSSALPNMPDHAQAYRSTELFALFKNRLMPKSRPDYQNYMSWLGIDNKKSLSDDLAVLAISGGEKETDFFRIIPELESTSNGNCIIKFYAHGLSDLDEHANQRTLNLNKGARLYLMHDFQNKFDKCALILRTDEPPCLVGYVPAFFTQFILSLKNKENGSDVVKVEVLQVNKNAPVQMRLLCELTTPYLGNSWEAYNLEFAPWND